jgi:SAM-dependent methyltransferase
MDSTYFDKDYFTNGVLSNKSGYDAEAFNITNDVYEHQAEMLIRILKLIDKKVMDIGTARGNLIYQLRKCGVDAYGQDISEWCKLNSHAKDYHFLGDAQDFIHKKNLDAVVSFEVFEHFDRPEAAIKNISEALNIGGILFATIGTDSRDEEENLDQSHVTVQNRDFWHNILVTNGFVERKDLYDKFFWDKLISKWKWDVFVYEKK